MLLTIVVVLGSEAVGDVGSGPSTVLVIVGSGPPAAPVVVGSGVSIVLVVTGSGASLVLVVAESEVVDTSLVVVDVGAGDVDPAVVHLKQARLYITPGFDLSLTRRW